MVRDMTRREFAAALRRRGWRLELLWIVGLETFDGHTMGVGIVTDRKGKLMRRATLANAIRVAAAEEAKRVKP